DTSQTGRVTGDASAWPASLPAGVSLPGVFARADRRPPPPALYHLFLLP
ncbi:TPA: pilus assembly protein, partial [Escherichia coli]